MSVQKKSLISNRTAAKKAVIARKVSGEVKAAPSVAAPNRIHAAKPAFAPAKPAFAPAKPAFAPAKPAFAPLKPLL
ncbi:MAG TPA: hypothetical protein VMU61_11385 [Candidatus Aquilonibacter sp.]|nr:hypothetical protein [Candidatus Aquilonibacter sp.]